MLASHASATTANFGLSLALPSQDARTDLLPGMRPPEFDLLQPFAGTFASGREGHAVGVADLATGGIATARPARIEDVGLVALVGDADAEARSSGIPDLDALSGGSR